MKNKNKSDKTKSQSKNSPKKKQNETSNKKRSDLEKEILKSIFTNDSNWTCTVIIVTVQTERLYNEMNGLKEIPYITVVTKESLFQNSKEGKAKSKSKTSSKTGKRSKSKTTTKSNKAKSGNSTNKKKSKITSTKYKEIGAEDSSNAETCLLLKKLLIDIKNNDLENNNYISKKIQEPNSEIKIKNYKHLNYSDDRNSTFKMKHDINVEQNLIHRYIVLWGVYYPNMLEVMIEFGIPVKALIHIKETDYEETSQNTPDIETDFNKKNTTNNAKNIGAAHINVKPKENENISHDEQSEANKNIIFLTYTSQTDNHKAPNNNFKINFQKILGDIKMAWDSFEIYLDTMKIIEVPFETELELEKANLYVTMISMVPLESVNVPTVIHCMLEQIAWWNGEIVSTKEDSFQDCDSTKYICNSVLDEEIENSLPILIDEKDKMYDSANNPKNTGLDEEMKSSLSILIDEKDDTKYNNYQCINILKNESLHNEIENSLPILIDEKDEYNIDVSTGDIKNAVLDQEIDNITPVLIDDTDEVRYKTFHLHLPEFDFENISINMYSKSPIYSLWKNYLPHTLPKFKFYDYHIYKLKNVADGYYSNYDKLFIMYLHQTVLNILVSKIKQLEYLSNNNENIGLSNDGFSNEHNSSYFNINSKLSVTRERIKNPDESKDQLYREERIQKLKEYLICSEFENLLREFTNNKIHDDTIIDYMREYEFVKEYNISTLSQSLQNAFQSFLNLDFLYCAPTDSILLWFNKIVDDGKMLPHSIETKLGFQEFYRYKFKGKLNFEEMEMQNDNHSLNGSQDFYLDQALSHETPNYSNYTCLTAYNLESIYMETNDTLKCFFSPDSSYVRVKDIKYFSNKNTFIVNIHKNDVSLSYELNPYVSNIHITVRLHNDIIANFSLQWSTTKSINSDHTRNKESRTSDQIYIPTEEVETSFLDDTISDPDVKSNSEFRTSDQIDVLPQELSSTSLKNTISNPDLETNKEIITSESINMLPRKLSSTSSKDPISETNEQPPYLHNFDETVTVPQDQMSINNEQTPSDHNQLLQDTLDIPDEDMSVIDCNLTITLPTGLMVEIVPTDTVLGPFYIRQTYLSKGPSCSKIWEESKRCYFRNGTIVIFFSDGTVDILNSNGTKTKCNAFELTESKILQQNDNPDNNEQTFVKIEEQTKSHKSKKKGSKIQKKKNNSTTNSPKQSRKVKKQNINTFQPPLPIEEECLAVAQIEMNNNPLYNISHHSVLSWDGEYKEFKNGELIYTEKRESKNIAFDHINQELYLIRSDGMATLFSPENVTVAFPDGSKITSMAEDEKVLHLSSSSNIENTDEINEFIFVETKYVLEHNNYATVIYNNSSKDVDIELPGNVRFNIQKDKLVKITNNENEILSLFNDYLIFETFPYTNSLTKSTSTLHFSNVQSSPTIFCKTTDCFGNTFLVDEDGSTSLTRDNGCVDDNLLQACQHPENIQRFFVFKRDLTGYELIHKHFQDRSFESISDLIDVLKYPLSCNNMLYKLYKQIPIHKDTSEQFLMEKAKEKLLPKLIKRKDLVSEESLPVFWFIPEISTVTQTKTNVKTCLVKMPKALVISEKLRINRIDYDIFFDFVKLLKTYFAESEEYINKYLNFYLHGNKINYGSKTSQEFCKDLFGSNSYYLVDNLPLVPTNNNVISQKPLGELESVIYDLIKVSSSCIVPN